MSEHEPKRFERAALRWLARYALERKDANLAGLREAVEAFSRLDTDRAASLATLQRLSRLQ